MRFSKIILFLTVVLCLSSGCSKDEESDPNQVTNDLILGNWDATSLTIDGVEQIGSTLKFMEMEFVISPDSDIEGSTEWTLVSVLNDIEKFDGEYKVKNQGNTLEFDGGDFNIGFAGSRLELSGNLNGDRWEIEAER